MRFLKPSIGVIALLTLAVSSAAHADGFRRWDVCGGNAFRTCASVELTVVGNQVTMRVWNLSGLFDSYGGTVFTGIGLYNLPAGMTASGLTVTGPARPGDSPSGSRWGVGTQQQIGGGVRLDVVPFINGVDASIASGCAESGQLPGGSNNLFQNPCATGLPAAGDAGWVAFDFTVSQTFDPATVELLVKGQNGPNGASTECITGAEGNCAVVPEPLTMTLLGTGLAGIGLARRRRRKALDASNS